MTREEAIVYGNDYYADLISACCKIDEKHKEFVRMSLEALEQEPCEDCISREEVCDYIAEFVNHEYATDREREMVKHIIGGIQHLPSIQPKVGHWIPFDFTYGRSVYYCSNCEESADVPTEMRKPIFKYCPNCGARMEDYEET